MNIIFPRNYMGHAGLDILWSSVDIVCAHIPLWQSCLCAFDLLGGFAIGKCHYFILFHCIALHCCKLHHDLGLAGKKTYKKTTTKKSYRFTLKWPKMGFYFIAVHCIKWHLVEIFSKQSDLNLADNQTCKQKKKSLRFTPSDPRWVGSFDFGQYAAKHPEKPSIVEVNFALASTTNNFIRKCKSLHSNYVFIN